MGIFLGVTRNLGSGLWITRRQTAWVTLSPLFYIKIFDTSQTRLNYGAGLTETWEHALSAGVEGRRPVGSPRPPRARRVAGNTQCDPGAKPSFSRKSRNSERKRACRWRQGSCEWLSPPGCPHMSLSSVRFASVGHLHQASGRAARTAPRRARDADAECTLGRRVSFWKLRQLSEGSVAGAGGKEEGLSQNKNGNSETQTAGPGRCGDGRGSGPGEEGKGVNGDGKRRVGVASATQPYRRCVREMHAWNLCNFVNQWLPINST